MNRANAATLADCQQQAGFLGLGADLVQVSQARMRPLLDHLLGTVLFADQLDHAVEIAKRIHHRYRVITLAGEVIATSGAMSGGRDQRERRGMLSQQQELKKNYNNRSGS